MALMAIGSHWQPDHICRPLQICRAGKAEALMDQEKQLTKFQRASLVFVVLFGILRMSILVVGVVEGLRADYIIRTHPKVDARIIKSEIREGRVSGLIMFDNPGSPERKICSVYMRLGSESHYLQLKEGQSLKVVPTEGCAAPISIYADRFYIVAIPFIIFISYFLIKSAKACILGKW